jgi:shikimate dehydrogenase
LNVTIPYKEKVIPYLNKLDETAKAIGAVNVIKFVRNNGTLELIGYNSDIIGFEKSFSPLLKEQHKKALILGTGGAAKGVAFVLNKLGIEYKFVSRTKNEQNITYEELSSQTIDNYTIIINASPIGTFPNVEKCPDILYEQISSKHLLYDLVYNPEKTLFLQKGEEKGAIIKNGLEMLHEQAIAAWNFWQ